MGAFEYFNFHIFCCSFSVYTDHQPLVTMFNSPRAQLSARIERWMMRMQPHTVTVRYRPGLDNPADYFSRHPAQQSPSSRKEKIAGEYLHHTVNTSTSKSMMLDTVTEKTAKDPSLTAVTNTILSSDWQVKDNVDTKTFRALYLCGSEPSLAHNASIQIDLRADKSSFPTHFVFKQ